MKDTITLARTFSELGINALNKNVNTWLFNMQRISSYKFKVINVSTNYMNRMYISTITYKIDRLFVDASLR